MKFLMKPIYIKFKLRSLLIFLIILGMFVSGVVLYKNYVFHNLFFKTLTTDKIESICVYNYYEQELTALSTQDAEAVVSLLCNVRLKAEPYKNFSIIGDMGRDYRIKLKNGIEFDLNLYGGNPSVYIFNDNAYSIGYRGNPNVADEFENLWNLEKLYCIQREKYYPADD